MKKWDWLRVSFLVVTFLTPSLASAVNLEGKWDTGCLYFEEEGTIPMAIHLTVEFRGNRFIEINKIWWWQENCDGEPHSPSNFGGTFTLGKTISSGAQELDYNYEDDDPTWSPLDPFDLVGVEGDKLYFGQCATEDWQCGMLVEKRPTELRRKIPFNRVP
jgi:hypothetical protein